LRSVLQNGRGEERVSDQFYIQGRIMLIALNGVEFEEVQSDLVVDNREIGGIFRVQRSLLNFIEALAVVIIELPLFLDRGRTEVVQLLVEQGAIVRVITGGGGRYRRKS